MASTLLLSCVKLIPRPYRVCRSMCQATQMGVSGAPLEIQSIPDDQKCVSSTDGLALMKNQNESESESESPIDDPSNLLAKRRRRQRWSPVFSDYVRGEKPDITYFRLDVLGSDPPELDSCNWFMKGIALDPPELDYFNWFRKEIDPEDQEPWLAQPSIVKPFVGQMVTRGVIPNLSTFSILVRSYCLDLPLPHLYQHIFDVVFTQMKAMGVKANGFFYRSLMRAVCTRFGPQSAYELLKMLRSSLEIQVPLLGYNPIVEHFFKEKMMQEVAMVLVDMKQNQVFPDGYIYVRLLKKHNQSNAEGLANVLGILIQMLAASSKMGVVSPTALYKSIHTQQGLPV